MGYVKLNRNLLRWEWFGNNNALLVLVRLTLKAAWRDTEYQGVALKRGQVITTLQEIADENQLTKQQARTTLDRLEATHKITRTGTKKFSIITLLDYDCFFENNTQSNTQITHEQHTEQHSNNTPTLSKEEEKNSKKGRREEGAAAPPAPPLDRKSLAEKYGEHAVSQYEVKYSEWQSKKGKAGGISYSTIARWLIEDGVPEVTSSMDPVTLRELRMQYSEDSTW